MHPRLRTMTSSDGSEPGAAVAEDGGAPALRLEQAALAGDGAAWATLVERHDHKVVVALLARGVPLDRARELAQETWLRLMEQQRRGRLTALTLPGLAIVQAGFLAANERRQPRAEGLGAAGELALFETAEDTAIGRQRLALLGRALAECPPGARRVFEQVYDHPELGYAEIAARVGLSVQRVKQTVFEVRKRLRAALEQGEQCDEEGT